jgi:hypothetical protein
MAAKMTAKISLPLSLPLSLPFTAKVDPRGLTESVFYRGKVQISENSIERLRIEIWGRIARLSGGGL